jgi:hypothetical protein
MAIPIAEGIISLQLEAFDGLSWFGQWDSDELGIPTAIRVTVSATGMQSLDDLHSPIITLRTIVPLDRFMAPADLYDLSEEDEDGDGLNADGKTGDDDDDDTGSSGGSGGGSGGKGDGIGGGSIITNADGSLTITDPDGNVHEIPSP